MFQAVVQHLQSPLVRKGTPFALGHFVSDSPDELDREDIIVATEQPSQPTSEGMSAAGFDSVTLKAYTFDTSLGPPEYIPEDSGVLANVHNDFDQLMCNQDSEGTINRCSHFFALQVVPVTAVCQGGHRESHGQPA